MKRDEQEKIERIDVMHSTCNAQFFHRAIPLLILARNCEFAVCWPFFSDPKAMCPILPKVFHRLDLNEVFCRAAGRRFAAYPGAQNRVFPWELIHGGISTFVGSVDQALWPAT
jgi:hypothetical protein